MCMYCNLFYQSSMYRCLGCLQYFAFTNNAVVDNLMQMYFLLLEVDLQGKFLEWGLLS